MKAGRRSSGSLVPQSVVHPLKETNAHMHAIAQFGAGKESRTAANNEFGSHAVSGSE